MFTRCIFCHKPLGTNEMIESFPVGRRLAFDGGKGRLWVVCTSCGQWNLTPLEERWEAIEECERSFRDTRLRVSTDNIGLARLADGLTLVRIGQPQRPELAAWRYGDQFGRRRRKYFLLGGAGALAIGGVVLAGPVAGLLSGGVVTALNYTFQAAVHYRRLRHVIARIPTDGGNRLELTRIHVDRAKLVQSDSPEGWAISVAHRGPGERVRWSMTEGLKRDIPTTELSGEAAVRAARIILPRLNASGGTRSVVRDAVDLLQSAGAADSCFSAISRGGAGIPGLKPSALRRSQSVQVGDPDSLRNLSLPVRLALEMAAHEEIERRALEGELAKLEDEWREAEEIAAIADDMFVPESVQRFIERHRPPAGSGLKP